MYCGGRDLPNIASLLYHEHMLWPWSLIIHPLSPSVSRLRLRPSRKTDTTRHLYHSVTFTSLGLINLPTVILRSLPVLPLHVHCHKIKKIPLQWYLKKGFFVLFGRRFVVKVMGSIEVKKSWEDMYVWYLSV